MGNGLGITVRLNQGHVVHDDLAAAVLLGHADLHKTVGKVTGLESPPLGQHGSLFGRHGLGRVDRRQLLAEVALGDGRDDGGEAFHLLRKGIPGHGTVLDQGGVAIALDTKAKTLRRGIEVVADRGTRKRGNPV